MEDVVGMQVGEGQRDVVNDAHLQVVGERVEERSRKPVRLFSISSMRRMGLRLTGSCTIPRNCTMQGCFKSRRMRHSWSKRAAKSAAPG